MTYDDKVLEMRLSEVEALRKFYQDTYPLLKKLNYKLSVANTALNVLAKSGNPIAKAALEEMNK